MEKLTKKEFNDLHLFVNVSGYGVIRAYSYLCKNVGSVHMLTRIGTITVQVSDQDKALAFYTEKLGFEVRANMPMGPTQRWIEVAPPGAQSRILLYKATPEMPGSDSYEYAQSRLGKPTPVVLEVDDIVATFEDLKAKGVTIVDEPKKMPYGWWGTFADQDGNTYGVHQ
jgi:predicted enzyme related to lactoylglutathione lyase